MAENTKIQWAHHTFNPWIGCTKVAPGCEHCYAEAQMDRRLGKAHWGPKGTRVKTSPYYWREPLKWNREAEAAGERRRVFCASLADVFEDWQGRILDSKGIQLTNATTNSTTNSTTETAGPKTLPLSMDQLRRDLFDVIDATPHLDWLLLTKRPENILRMWPECNLPENSQPHSDGRDNVWLITSIAKQADADRNIPLILECRDLVPVLGVSAEPLLGPINLREIGEITAGIVIDGKNRPLQRINALTGNDPLSAPTESLNWVIVGGESGHEARVCDVDWIRSIVKQCRGSAVPCFVKQLGSRIRWGKYGGDTGPQSGTRLAGGVIDPKAGDPAEWPEDLRVRDFPYGVLPRSH